MNKVISEELLITLFIDPTQSLTLSQRQWSNIIQVLRHEKLLARYGLLIDAAIDITELPAFVQRHLKSAITLAERHTKQVHFELAELKPLFDANTANWLILKGAAYTASGYAAGLGRVYNDIDILVDKPHLETAERALIMSGWMPQEIDDYDEAYYRKWTHEIPPLQHGYRGTMMDLHHNLVPPVSGRAPDISLIFDHITHTPTGMPILALPAMALHSAIHLFFNDDFSASLRDLTDLYLMFNEMTPSQWDTVFDLALSTGFETELAMAMDNVAKRFHITLSSEQSRFVLTHTHERQRNWMFAAMGSEHPLVISKGKWRYTLFAWLRGHALKMPISTLCYHLSMKAYRLTVERILGKHFFTKQDEGTARVTPQR